MIDFGAFSDELVKIAGLAPLAKKVPEGVTKLRQMQRLTSKIGSPGTPSYRNILGGKLYGGR